jgi:hypothetical protein
MQAARSKLLITKAFLQDIEACYLEPDAPYWQHALVTQIPPEGVTPEQVLICEKIPSWDRFWLLMHLLSDRDARLLACRITSRALQRADVKDQLAWRAVCVAAKYAVGCATLQELDEVCKVARIAWCNGWRANYKHMPYRGACRAAWCTAYNNAQEAVHEASCAVCTTEAPLWQEALIDLGKYL